MYTRGDASYVYSSPIRGSGGVSIHIKEIYALLRVS